MSGQGLVFFPGTLKWMSIHWDLRDNKRFNLEGRATPVPQQEDVLVLMYAMLPPGFLHYTLWPSPNAAAKPKCLPLAIVHLALLTCTGRIGQR